jgi:SAM-dependent methyltransferase
MSFDRETGRDRYFEARDRELQALVDPSTGHLAAAYAQRVDCPLCGSPSHRELFEKQGFTFVCCADCGLVFVNPQLKESVALDGYRSADSGALWVEVLTSDRQQALDREKFSEVLDALEPHRGEGRLLDVGCSIGLFLDLARDRGWQGVGIELAPRALAMARGRGLEVQDVPLGEAGFVSDSFDAVALLSVLEHTPDPRSMLGECRRVLRAGGAVYVVVPNVESLACRVLREKARTFDGRNHLVYFSPSTLRDALEQEGFEVADMNTRITSLEPVLRHLAGEEPYGDTPPQQDRLARWTGEHEQELERVMEELHLGYKLHCLALSP